MGQLRNVFRASWPKSDMPLKMDFDCIANSKTFSHGNTVFEYQLFFKLLHILIEIIPLKSCPIFYRTTLISVESVGQERGKNSLGIATSITCRTTQALSFRSPNQRLDQFVVGHTFVLQCWERERERERERRSSSERARHGVRVILWEHVKLGLWASLGEHAAQQREKERERPSER